MYISIWAFLLIVFSSSLAGSVVNEIRDRLSLHRQRSLKIKIEIFASILSGKEDGYFEDTNTEVLENEIENEVRKIYGKGK